MSSSHIAFSSSAVPIAAAAAADPVPEPAAQPRAFHYSRDRRPAVDTRPPPSLKTLAPSPLPSPSPSPSFLPRTSSLLPAARVAPAKLSSPVTSSFAFPPNATDARPKTVSPPSTADPQVILSPPDAPAPGTASAPPGSPVRHGLFHRPSHSSSSSRAAPDPVRAFHRWSTSTISSRASVVDSRPLVHRHQRSASFSRRLSTDSIASSLHRVFDPASRAAASAAPTVAPPPPPSFSASPGQQHTPRKLQKTRPPVSHTGSPLRASPRAHINRELPPVPSVPFESLPPIVALPSLEQEFGSGPSSLLGRSATPPPQRPRPYARHPSSEDNIRSFYFGNATPAAAATVTEERPVSASAASPHQNRTPPRPAPVPPPPVAASSATTMPYPREPQPARPPSRGYTRSRTETTKGSTDSTRSRGSRPPSQKAMLSRALQKANTAVQLDNASNVEGAREAYTEACDLLQQVLFKTPGHEDKLKLEAIRETYAARIEELDELEQVSAQAQDTRPLPQRPRGNGAQRDASPDSYLDDEASSDDVDEEEEAVIETVTVTRIYNDNTPEAAQQPRSIPSYSVPLAAPSSSPRLLQSAYAGPANNSHVSLLNDQYTLQSSFSRSPRSEFAPPNRPWGAASANTLQPPATINPYMPPPLSPRRMGPPPRPFEEAPAHSVADYAPATSDWSQRSGNNNSKKNGLNGNGNGAPVQGHTRTASHESASWLDPIHESSSSGPSSVHSRSSSMKVRRKHIRAASGATEAEFDAALDDAIEAAYDDGYEPMLPAAVGTARPSNFGNYKNDDDPVSNSLRRVELAKERVRETEREAKAFEREFRLREQLRQQQQQLEEDQEQQRPAPERGLMVRDITTNFLNHGDDSEDEERLLEEMTTAIEDFALGSIGPKTKPPLPPQPPPMLPLPREPGSSVDGSVRAWHRPVTPNAAMAAAAAAAAASMPGSSFEQSTAFPGTLAKGPTYVMPPPPTQALPQLPPQPHRPPTSASQSPARAGSSMSVRSRRLSGQTMKQLKIETTKLGPPPPFNGGRLQAPASNAYANASSLSASAAMPQQPRTTGFLAQQRQALSAGPRPGSSAGLRPGSSAGPRPGSSAGPRPGSSAGPRPGSSAGPRPGSSAAGSSMPFSMRQGPTPSPGANATKFFGASPTEHMPPPNFPPPTPPIPQNPSFGGSESTAGRSGSPSGGQPGLRKNFSSSSLRSMRSRNMSVTNLDGTSDMSPGTPLSNHFVPAASTRLPEVPSLPAPAATAMKDRTNGVGGGVGGLHLLENDFHSPTTPGSPNALATDAPVPLEPCPSDTLLRPFWLMRCLYQTLAHPRGGYLSNKLFVPTDVWRVKGVKLKNVDEKVANCELLTEALLKLARVDEYDADAVLEEMEALESVLEQVQVVLTRKLGSEVGVQSTHALFKDASPIAHDHEVVSGGASGGGGVSGGGGAGGAGAGGGASSSSGGLVPRTGSVSNNGSRSFSWRRLRPKNSSVGLNSGFAAATAGGNRKETGSDGGSAGNGGVGGAASHSSSGGAPPKDGGTLASLPMTAHPTSRPAKRDVASVRFSGPNAAYMAALARLFDAAQFIDQVARQVEDPGLRHADKTQVGLELSTRHAAEFFAFYICRFVLSDVSLLLEKFIKRGSEWVMV